MLFGGAVALLPAIAEDRLGVGSVGYGWLRAAPGIGAVLRHGAAGGPAGRAGASAGRCSSPSPCSAWRRSSSASTSSYVVAFVALVVLSGADAVSVFIRATIVPLATPDHMRGRVMAVENVFIGASNELGAFESGVAGTLLGVGPAVVARRRADARRRRHVVVRCSRRCATSTASRTSPSTTDVRAPSADVLDSSAGRHASRRRT